MVARLGASPGSPGRDTYIFIMVEHHVYCKWDDTSDTLLLWTSGLPRPKLNGNWRRNILEYITDYSRGDLRSSQVDATQSSTYTSNVANSTGMTTPRGQSQT